MLLKIVFLYTNTTTCCLSLLLFMQAGGGVAELLVRFECAHGSSYNLNFNIPAVEIAEQTLSAEGRKKIVKLPPSQRNPRA